MSESGFVAGTSSTDVMPGMVEDAVYIGMGQTGLLNALLNSVS
jgi:hypothetical protein